MQEENLKVKLKLCTTCHIEKDISEFNKKKNRRDGLQTLCKECSRARSRKYYKDNKTEHLKVIAIRRKKEVAANQRFVYEYLKTHPCINCGETDTRCLEFDHLRDKKEVVSKLISGWSLKTVQKEIEKCQVLCANCHRKKTAEDFNWFCHRMMQEDE